MKKIVFILPFLLLTIISKLFIAVADKKLTFTILGFSSKQPQAAIPVCKTKKQVIIEPAEIKPKTVIFIHGMFQNAKSWESWARIFRQKGYNCIVESWPLHEGNPSTLRENIPGALAKLRLDNIYDKFAALAAQYPDAILIGHSVGGLIVQKLLNNGFGSAGICISSVSPNKMQSPDRDFYRANAKITNPFEEGELFKMTSDTFYENFGNAMTRKESDEAYELTATHDSRKILKDCLKETGTIDLSKTNKPILFIAAAKDKIIPPDVIRKNAEVYPKELTKFHEFKGRGHFICGQKGWEEVAYYSYEWIEGIK
jgi:pimeloyl-ACP methyl ester carboxylesterase